MNWNLDEVRKRYDLWWGPEQAGPLVFVEIARDGAARGKDFPSWVTSDIRWGVFHQWLSDRETGSAGGKAGGKEDLLQGSLDCFSASRFAGDAYPRINLNFGPGSVAAHLSGFLKLGDGTTWFELDKPMSWDAIFRLEAREDNRWWVMAKELTAYLAGESRNRYTVCYPDLGGLMDILASLRTSNQLLEDLIEEPDQVKRALQLILGFWHKYYDDLSKILAEKGQEGTGAWMEMWCRQRWYPLQCDIAAMLSPDMFGEFAMPTLTEQCARIDQPIFHWDGPGQLRHLDHLLSIKRLAGIQWVPGAGQAGQEAEKWFPYYERILGAGKRLVLNYLPPSSIPGLITRFGGKGLFLGAWCDNESQALDLAQKLRLPVRE